MGDASTWQRAFVATTFILGDSLEDARASLGEADLAVTNGLMTALAHPERHVRARTLAAALGRIAADLETARLA
jgi:hypothetical protein